MNTTRFVLLALLPLYMLAACTSQPKTEPRANTAADASSTAAREERNKQTAIANVTAFLTGDMNGILKDAAPDMVDYNDGSMPPLKGADSIRLGIQQWRESFSDYKCDNMVAFADGDYVVITGEWNATFKKDFGDMKVEGKSFKVKDADIFRFNAEGKITEHRSIQSSLEMMKQLGIDTDK